MIDINLNGAEPTHVDRIKPQFSIDSAGNISWQPGLIDYDASVFHRGKVVTNDEYNTLFLKNVYQGNYNADSLNTLLKEHLGTIIHRKFTSLFNIKDSYAKVFSQSDWGTQQADGYYYITIPTSEHGFEPNTDKLGADQVTVDTEMYVLDTNGNLVELPQVSVALDNTVTVYTDDNTLTGFIIVRLNDKAVVYADVKIDASQVTGLEEVAISGRYADLKGLDDVDGPNYKLAELNHKFEQLGVGELVAAKAADAVNAANLTSTIRNVALDDIFEVGSSVVKNSTNTSNLKDTIRGVSLSDIFETDNKTIKNATTAAYSNNFSGNFAQVTSLNGQGGSYELRVDYTYGNNTGSYSFGVVCYNPARFVSISPSIKLLSPNNGSFLTLTIDRSGAITVWLDSTAVSATVYARKVSI